MYMLISHINDETVITLNLKNEEEISKAIAKANASFNSHQDDITHQVFLAIRRDFS